MAATITVALATVTTPRVSITIGGWATDGPLTVYRAHPDGSSWAVRGLPDVSGGVTFGYDYEAPFNVAVSYSAAAVSSSPVTIPVTDAWLLIPGLPQQSQQVLPQEIPDDSFTRPMEILGGPFRQYPAIEFGELSSASASLQLITYTDSEFASLMAMLRQSGTHLVRMPGSTWDWRYVAISAVHPVAAAPILGQWLRITALSTVAVQPPAGGSFGDPTASYQALVDSGKTYQTLLDWQGVGATTYLDMLKGGF